MNVSVPVVVFKLESLLLSTFHFHPYSLYGLTNQFTPMSCTRPTNLIDKFLLKIINYVIINLPIDPVTSLMVQIVACDIL